MSRAREIYSQYEIIIIIITSNKIKIVLLLSIAQKYSTLPINEIDNREKYNLESNCLIDALRIKI
jgi:hypothetical protein